jgi:hypothetical protein
MHHGRVCAFAVERPHDEIGGLEARDVRYGESATGY